MTDDGLKFILLYALAYGNYLNGQSTRGGAFGFKIDIVKSLDEIKSSDKKLNLMMYIIEKAESTLKKDLINHECISIVSGNSAEYN